MRHIEYCARIIIDFCVLDAALMRYSDTNMIDIDMIKHILNASNCNVPLKIKLSSGQQIFKFKILHEISILECKIQMIISTINMLFLFTALSTGIL